MNMKKMIRTATATLLLAISATVTASALELPCDGYLIGNNVNLRSGPDTTYGSYGTFGYGTQYELLEQEGNWFKVSTPLPLVDMDTFPQIISAQQFQKSGPVQ